MKRMRILSGLLIIALLFSVAVPVKSYAEKGMKVVRVGYAGSENFTGGAAPGEHKSGYAYEYLQLIAASLGWEYEYVYGDWSELFELLKKGEIDIMPGISYTEERAGLISYPDHEMGFENYFIFAKQDSEYVIDSQHKIEGAICGTIEGSLMEAALREWNSNNGSPCTIETFAGFDGLYDAINNGTIDLIVDTDNGVMVEYGLEAVTKVGYSNYYLAVSKASPDILAELNGYIDDLATKNPYLINNLQYKYFANSEVKLSFGNDSKKYLKENPVIKIGYEKNFLAFCGYDEKTGECIGALRVFVDNIYKNFGTSLFTVELVPYENVGESLDALKRGEVDVAFTLYQSYYEAEENDLILSNSIAETGMTALVASGGRFNEYEANTVAVTKGFTDIEWYIRDNYPTWEIIEYDSFEECVKAVENGEADCVVESTYVYKNLVDYRTVKMVALSNSADLCFAMRQNDYMLGRIINQMISANPKADFQAALSLYSYSMQGESILQIVKDNLLVVGGIVGLTLLIMILILLGLHEEQKKAEAAQKETEIANKTLKENQAILESALEGAEAANRAKTVFLSNMSHDIRTPMNAIIGFADLLEMNKDNPEIISDYVGKIQSSGEYLLSLINNVLDMARIESGKVVLDETETNINDDIEKTVILFEDTAKKKNITITSKVDVVHPYVRCDTMKIKQIAMNLISNAIKYTRDGGNVEVSIREIASGKDGYGRYVTMVSDTGIGMSSEFVDQIFESFSRERDTTQSQIMGTGLGMAIVKRLVDLMDGKITVKSEPGKGTCITVILNLKIIDGIDDSKKNTLSEYVDTGNLRGKRLLLAEDNDLNYEIASNILTNAGFTTDRAKDGVECVSIIKSKAPNYYFAILMDIQMPRLDGYGATMEIRELTDGRGDIPIIAMTANAFEEDKGRALAAGMDGHIVKPIKLAAIVEELSRFTFLN